jgi:hypothetical protein
MSLAAIALALSFAAAPDAYEVLIIGGGKTRAEAEAALDKFKKDAESFLNGNPLKDNYPKIVESASITGLNAGFFIAVLGFCSEKHDVEPLKKALSQFMHGSYTKKVSGNYAGLCPPFPLFSSIPEKAYLTRLKAAPKSEQYSFEYAHSLHIQGRFDDAKKQLEKILELNAGHEDAKSLLHTIAVLETD